MSKESKKETGWFTYHPVPQKIKSAFTGHVCPWCHSKAEGKFVISEKSLLDPSFRKVGTCVNKDCLNSAYYIDAHPDPLYTKKELRSRKRKFISGCKMVEMEVDPNLLQTRLTNLVKKRLEKLGHDDIFLG